jgi:SAM-dependent methyltransferase
MRRRDNVAHDDDSVAVVSPFARQCRRPTGWIGRVFLWRMNRSHSGLTDWGLSSVEIGRAFTILDVGCGGGRTVQKLAAAASAGKVYGVDYSATCVAASRRTNAAAIAAGRVDIREGSVSQLPFPDATFDLVTAVETHYYWPDLEANVREILRVLKPGGRLAIVAEVYKGSRNGRLHERAMQLVDGRLLSVSEFRDLLSNAGYAEVDVREEHQKAWIAVTGRRIG